MLYMSIADIRRENLRALVEAEGLATIARRAKKPDRQINDMLAGRKSFGEKVARDIENKMGLDTGALDRPITGSTTGTSPQRAVETAEQRINPLTIIRRLDGQVTPRSKATLLRLEKLAIEGSLTDEEWSLLEGIVDRFERAHRA